MAAQGNLAKKEENDKAPVTKFNAIIMTTSEGISFQSNNQNKLVSLKSRCVQGAARLLWPKNRLLDMTKRIAREFVRENIAPEDFESYGIIPENDNNNSYSVDDILLLQSNTITVRLPHQVYGMENTKIHARSEYYGRANVFSTVKFTKINNNEQNIEEEKYGKVLELFTLIKKGDETNAKTYAFVRNLALHSRSNNAALVQKHLRF